MPTELKDLPPDVIQTIEKNLKKKTYKTLYPTDPLNKSSYRSAIKAKLLARPSVTSLQKAFMDVDLAKDTILKTSISKVSEFDPKSQGHPTIRNLIPMMRKTIDEVETLLKKMHTDLNDTINFYDIMTNGTPLERGEYVIAKIDRWYNGESLYELTQDEFDALLKRKFWQNTKPTYMYDNSFNPAFVRIFNYTKDEFNDVIAGFGAVALNDDLIAKLQTIIERYVLLYQGDWHILVSSRRDHIKNRIAYLNTTLRKSPSAKGGGKRQAKVVKK